MQNSLKDVPAFPVRFLLDTSTACNLKCKMCLQHASHKKSGKIMPIKGIPISKLKDILDEIKDAKSLIQPSYYGEPLMAPNFREIISLLKNMHFTLAINTNGTLFDSKICHFFVDYKIDSVSFSLDALNNETYVAIRGFNKLEKIKASILKLLEIRGEKLYPRIGVSFCRQEDNIIEEKQFIEFWSRYVDVIRVNALSIDGEHDMFGFHPIAKKRIPCGMLYDTMPILYNGDVPICCRDYSGKYIMGNVFQESVSNVWNGTSFQKVRQLHENRDWDKIPICSNCDAWAITDYEEEVTDRFLIRKSPLMYYYNNIDRLEGWKGFLLGSHKTPNKSYLK